MNKIKNFIYLDDYKMYSISSQIFEGMTEYIIESTSSRLEEKNEQKGTLGSGRLMADIIEKQKNETEKKFLHDYSYTLFENELVKNNKVITINNENFSEQLNKIPQYNFIKVTARVAFNDTQQVANIMSKFNDLGVALTHITHAEQLSESKKLLGQVKEIKDRNIRSKTEQLLKTSSRAAELAKETGLYKDPDFLNSLTEVLNYGYHSQFEVQMPFSIEGISYLFSAILKRDKLKETELNIVKKHARLSEKDFTIFGILTQVSNAKKEMGLYRDRNDEGKNMNMKEAIMNMIFHITNIEATFTGKLDYEYVIDPIAIYQEI